MPSTENISPFHFDMSISISPTPLLLSAEGRATLETRYRSALLDDVIPFWLRHGIDHQYGGLLSCLDRDGTVIDTDKSIWAQGRTAWMLASLYNSVEARSEWLEGARHCLDFVRKYGAGPEGKLWFSVTQDGHPLRMRRYVYSEAFAAIGSAAYARATGEERALEDAKRYYATYLRHSFEPGVMPAKTESSTRPSQSVGALMFALVTAQEIRLDVGEQSVSGRTLSEWIRHCITRIERYFMKPDIKALLEVAGPNGEVIDHGDGRTLNPGHALECAWFIMREGRWQNDQSIIQLGLNILEWMWPRGWDEEFGGLRYFADLYGRPVQEYWHDMKFWWPHNEAEIVTLLAWQHTGEARYAEWHQLVHDWSFSHFPDPEYGEWFGYLHRDGSPSSSLKGSLWKSCFHLPRMLFLNWRLLQSDAKF